MSSSRPIAAASLILLLGCAACANGSTSNYTQSPIFFNDGPSQADEALAGDGAAFVTAEGNAILPLGPAATPAAAPSPELALTGGSTDLSGGVSVGPGGLAAAAGLSAGAGANITAKTAVSTAPVTLSLQGQVLGGAPANAAVLAAPSAINPALVTSVTNRKQSVLCTPSLGLKC